jgi:hypothetical protein
MEFFERMQVWNIENDFAIHAELFSGTERDVLGNMARQVYMAWSWGIVVGTNVITLHNGTPVIYVCVHANTHGAITSVRGHHCYNTYHAVDSAVERASNERFAAG